MNVKYIVTTIHEVNESLCLRDEYKSIVNHIIDKHWKNMSRHPRA